MGNLCYFYILMNPAETYILEQPEPFKSMLLQAQVLVEQTLPDVDLHYKWNLPMYFVGKCPICFFNVTKGYLDICFWVRDTWEVHLEVLNAENRKFVRSLRYFQSNEMNAQHIIECVEEAYRTKKKGFTS